MSRFLRHDSCPRCGSKDNLAVYEDHEYCFSEDCNYYKSEGKERTISNDKSPKLKLGLPAKEMPGLDSRGINPTSVNKYKVSISINPDTDIEAVFPRFDSEGEHIANQVRSKDKQFRTEGRIKDASLFGQNFFTQGQRTITVTEGYYDTLSSFQLTGSRYPTVGVMSSGSALKEFTNNFEYLNSFDRVVINFDNDLPGQNAAKKCAQLFAPGKACIMALKRGNDANEYLQEGWAADYVNEFFRAPPYMPDGLKLGSELWEDIRDHKTPKSVPYPWKGLNEKTYGLRLSEFVLIMADTGVGKTSVCKEIEHSLLSNEELKKEGVGVGFLHFEEPKYDTAIGLMSIEANKPYHLPDTERTETELREVYTKIIDTDRVVIWDHFGSNTIDAVIDKVRHMAALGCKYMVVDHLSIIVSDQSGDERKQLDEISTRLKTLCMNLSIHLMCVIHVNRQGQARGSAGPEQVSNIVMRLERDKKDPDDWRRNITTIVVEKNRFCGKTGPACLLFYNEVTNRLEELSPDQVQQYEAGGSNTGHEMDGM